MLTIEELSARAEIADLLARYGFYADAGAFDAWLDLFCADVYMDVPDYASADEEATVRLQGADELRASIFDAPAVRAMRGRAQHHLTGPMSVLVDGDHAQADSYGMVLILPADGAGGAVPSLSFNRWILRRVDGAWKIAGCVRRRAGQSAPLLRELASRAYNN